jgi:hypothetical protein
MTQKRLPRHLKADIGAVDVWFGLAPGLIAYAALISWAEVIVRALKGEEAKDNWKTRSSSAVLIGIWTITSGARVRDMASLRGAAVEMRGLVRDRRRRRSYGISGQPSRIVGAQSSKCGCSCSRSGWSPWRRWAHATWRAPVAQPRGRHRHSQRTSRRQPVEDAHATVGAGRTPDRNPGWTGGSRSIPSAAGQRGGVAQA